MSRDAEKLKRYNISGIPLIKQVSDVLGLKSLFGEYIPAYGNENPLPQMLLCFLSGT